MVCYSIAISHVFPFILMLKYRSSNSQFYSFIYFYFQSRTPPTPPHPHFYSSRIIQQPKEDVCSLLKQLHILRYNLHTSKFNAPFMNIMQLFQDLFYNIHLTVQVPLP